MPEQEQLPVYEYIRHPKKYTQLGEANDQDFVREIQQ
jgi:hypothetical protein